MTMNKNKKIECISCNSTDLEVLEGKNLQNSVLQNSVHVNDLWFKCKVCKKESPVFDNEIEFARNILSQQKRKLDSRILDDKFREWSLIYLKAAENLYELNQRYVGFWVPAYYLLHQSMELAIKYIFSINNVPITENHNLVDLINKNNSFFILSRDDYEIIKKLEDLNKGRGGLRYPQNESVEGFLPSIFDKSVTIINNLNLKQK